LHCESPERASAAPIPISASRLTLGKGNRRKPCMPISGSVILLVEHDVAVRTRTPALLEDHGFKVVEAAGGLEAVAVMLSYEGEIAWPSWRSSCRGSTALTLPTSWSSTGRKPKSFTYRPRRTVLPPTAYPTEARSDLVDAVYGRLAHRSCTTAPCDQSGGQACQESATLSKWWSGFSISSKTAG
jgi:hypothetical protein